MYLSNNVGLGLGLSTVVFAATVRLMLSPIFILNSKQMEMNKLLQPDIQEIQKNAAEFRRLNVRFK